MVKQIKGFLDFVREQGVVGLAVGIVLGGAVSKLVGSLVNDIVSPVLGILFGATGNLDELTLTIGGSTIKYGSFLSNMIDFITIAAVIYFVVKGLRLDKLDKKKEPKP